MVNLSITKIKYPKNDTIEYLQFKRLLEFDNLVHCYTLSENYPYKE